MAYRRNIRDYKRSQQPAFEGSYKIWLEEELKKLETTLQSIVETMNPSYIGGFQSNVTQTVTTINTPKAIVYDTTDYSFGVSLGSPVSRIVVDNPGYYDLQFSAQISKSNAAAGYIIIWPKVNGVNVPESATKMAVQGSVVEIVAAWNFVLKLQASDYVELMWQVDDTHIQLIHLPSSTGVPEIPSVILTLTQVAQIR